MIPFEQVCLACKAGLHDECHEAFALALNGDAYCCCNGEYRLAAHLAQMWRAEQDGGEAVERPRKGDKPASTPEGPPRGNSGYIHPDAWPSSRDIGTLVDAPSTGRKRAAEMFPITPGQVCDWARQGNCGGGPRPIIGCMGSPATDIHHGPDKNTLNNAVARRGVGDTDNLWFLCSDCHNMWHANNDPFYPEYDRQERQAQPWIPHTDEPWEGHKPVEAGFDELAAEEQRREERRKTRGKETRGRHSGSRAEPDTTIRDED